MHCKKKLELKGNNIEKTDEQKSDERYKKKANKNI